MRETDNRVVSRRHCVIGTRNKTDIIRVRRKIVELATDGAIDGGEYEAAKLSYWAL